MGGRVDIFVSFHQQILKERSLGIDLGATTLGNP